MLIFKINQNKTDAGTLEQSGKPSQRFFNK